MAVHYCLLSYKKKLNVISFVKQQYMYKPVNNATQGTTEQTEVAIHVTNVVIRLG